MLNIEKIKQFYENNKWTHGRSLTKQGSCCLIGAIYCTDHGLTIDEAFDKVYGSSDPPAEDAYAWVNKHYKDDPIIKTLLLNIGAGSKSSDYVYMVNDSCDSKEELFEKLEKAKESVNV